MVYMSGRMSSRHKENNMEEITSIGRILTADAETIGLLDSIRKGKIEDIHIIHCKDFITGELFSFFDDFKDRINAVWLDDYEEGFKQGNILEGIKFLKECDLLIMQNISGFDALALEKVDSFDRDHFEKIENKIFPYKTADTLVMSNVLNPERKLPHEAFALGLGKTGPHSIAAHGIRMGRHKPDHDDWSHLSADMIHRCEEDVEIGEDLFIYLMKEWQEQLTRPNKITGLDIEDAYFCELRVAFSIARQAQRGFAFDVALANKLVKELDEKLSATEIAFRKHMPLRLKMKKVNEDYIEKAATNITVLGGNAVEYENYMLNGDSRMSYNASIWSVTKKNGEYSKAVTKCIPEAVGFLQDHPSPPVTGAFTPLLWEEVPLGNRDAVKQILFKHGWVGVNYNDAEREFIDDNEALPKPWAGKIDTDSIELWEESEHDVPAWCKGIAEWYVLKSRRTQILNGDDLKYYDLNGKWPRQQSGKNECRGLLSRCFNEDGMKAQTYYEENGCWPAEGEWRVSAQAFSCATNTFRMRHKQVVNIPSRGLYGDEMRMLFKASKGKRLLGCDGSGLELRMLAHYMNDPEYTDIVLNGDIHNHNKEQAHLPDRDKAKKFIYMFLYGAGIFSLSRDVNMEFKDMERCVALFRANLPKLDSLINAVQSSGKSHGYLLGLDGRRGRIRSKGFKISLNTALNVLLQMAGSLVMKWAHVIAEDLAVSEGVLDSVNDFPLVAHQHDEGQMEVDQSECNTTMYQIFKTEWDEDEKRQHMDDQGRIWSAPVISHEYKATNVLDVVRHYHPIGDIYCRALKQAGEFLGLRCETAGEYKIGETWHSTH